MSEAHKAKFITGSTMRHVVVMTTTGMLGLSFMFLVDAVTFYWVSRLDVEAYLAAISYAWTLQFFTIAFGVALMIAAGAMVAHSLGEEDFEKAKSQATATMVMSAVTLTVIAAVIFSFRVPLLRLVGAEGEALQVASNFLAISLPSLPFFALGMIGSAILRADGEAWRAMIGTMSTGLVAMIADPLFIFGFDMGAEGAALGISVSRIISALLVFYFVAFVSKLLVMPSLADIRRWLRPFAVIAAPALLTQIASPTGNVITTSLISDFGDAAVAGWGLLNRILVLAFGGVFALSGAIGGIIGQNYGAKKYDRVRSAYLDSVVFSTVYVLLVWIVLALLNTTLLEVFDTSEGAGAIVSAFNYFVAGSFIFAGILYVSNASFNNLGRPIYSTISNWIKDGLLIWPLCVLLSLHFGAVGVVYGTGVAWVIAGSISGIWGWLFVKRL